MNIIMLKLMIYLGLVWRSSKILLFFCVVAKDYMGFLYHIAVLISDNVHVIGILYVTMEYNLSVFGCRHGRMCVHWDRIIRHVDGLLSTLSMLFQQPIYNNPFFQHSSVYFYATGIQNLIQIVLTCCENTCLRQCVPDLNHSLCVKKIFLRSTKSSTTQLKPMLSGLAWFRQGEVFLIMYFSYDF